MKQTAVEWIQHKMATSTPKDIVNNINDWFNEAKEMEKEQIKDAWFDGVTNWDSEKEVEDYINETFKSE